MRKAVAMKAAFLAIAVLLLLAGCKSVEEKASVDEQAQSTQQQAAPAVPAVTPPRSIGVFASDDANESLVTSLDIVFLYDPALVKAMPADAPSWFDLKTRIRQRHAGTMDVVSLQVPPGVALAVKMPRRASDAVEVVAYASYLSRNGTRKLRLTPFRDVAIYLNEKMIEAGNK